MEKEFVPYNLSLKLKALGYDEPCFGMYCEGKFHLLYPGSYKDIPKDFYREVDAPTFSQAFRWFREKYGLSAIVSQFGYGIENIYGVIEHTIDEDENPICYEEAELACLDKLIEIVKNKSE